MIGTQITKRIYSEYDRAIYYKYILKQFPSIENLSYSSIDGVEDILDLYTSVLECAEQFNLTGENRLEEIRQYILRIKEKLKEPEPLKYCISCKKELKLDDFNHTSKYDELIDPEHHTYSDICYRCYNKNLKNPEIITYPSCDSIKLNLDSKHLTCNSYSKTCSICNYKFCDLHMNHKHGRVVKMCRLCGKNEATMHNGMCSKHPYSILYPGLK